MVAQPIPLTLPSLLTDGELTTWHDLIDKAVRIVICTHKGPDGDALGSSLALADYLLSEGKLATIIVPDAFPDFLTWLPGTNQICRYDKHTARAEQLLADADLIFCLDFNHTSRVLTMQGALDAAKAAKIVVDHHLNPDIDAQLLLSYPEMSSTSEIVFRIIHDLHRLDRVSTHFFTQCYCGMMTDTGNFAYGATTPQFFQIIAYLVSRGVDKDKVWQRVYNGFSAECLRFRAHIISERMRVDSAHHAAFLSIRRADMQRFKYRRGDAEGLVNEPLRIKDIWLSISLREDTEQDNLIWVSLRSVENRPCNHLAEQFFNGGGHPNAAGGRVFGTLEEAERLAKQAIEKWI